MGANRPSEVLPLFGRFVARTLGLHFPGERLAELEAKMLPLAKRSGFADPHKYLLYLMSAPLDAEQLDSLAVALTIGETYFLRDPNSYRALAERLLPELVAARRGTGKSLKIWSAGCSTGEEPYTIAILVSRAIPDLADWQLDIVGTDLNPEALERARQGVYSRWSFRNAPEWLMEYFSTRPDGRFQIAPRIRERVRFSQLNLADRQAVSSVAQGGMLDIIFCRNVMLYFDAERIAATVAAFRELLNDGGWLFVGPTELDHGKVSGFRCRHFQGAMVLEKLSAAEEAAEEAQATKRPPAAAAGPRAAAVAAPRHAAAALAVPRPASPPQRVRASAGAQAAVVRAEGREQQAAPAPAAGGAETWREAVALYRAGRYLEAAELAAGTPPAGHEAEAFALAARAYANLASFALARECCERALACEPLSAANHYLLSIVLEQQGDPEGAAASLKRALFIDHDYLLAYFALGNLHRRAGQEREARRSFAVALGLLEKLPADGEIEGAEGMTAAMLAELIRGLTGKGDRPRRAGGR